MAGEIQGQIDVKQKEIQSLKGPESAEAKIKKYQDTFIGAVDSGQQEITAADKQLKAPQATAYLESASQEILNHLGGIAQKGREILLEEEGSKEGEKAKGAPSIQDLSSKLQSELNALKPSIESFTVLEEIETKDLKAVEEQNQKLNNSEGFVKPSVIYTSKSELLRKLDSIETKYISTEKSKSYAQKLVEKHKTMRAQIDREQKELVIGPMVSFTAIGEFAAAASAYETLVQEAKDHPSIELVNKAKAQAELIDPEKVHEDHLAELGKGSYAYLQNLASHLESQYKKARATFEGGQNSFEYVEEEAVYGAAEKMLADVTEVEKEDLLPTWKEYQQLSYRTDLKGKELENFEAQESGMMSGYLTLKMTVTPFMAPETFSKFKGDTDGLDKRVTAKAGEIDQKIRQIEVNRQTRRSTASLAEVNIGENTTENLLQYVTFMGEEKEGKIYFFNPSFESLPAEKQQKIRMAVESLIARDQNLVKKQTQNAIVELNKSSGNFDKISELLGGKSKRYIEGLKLLSQGKHDEALTALQAYVAQSFSEEEAALNEGALKDAREKISLLSLSEDFYKGLSKYKEGDANAAAKLLAEYIRKMEEAGGEEKKLHAEQLSQARDLFKMIGMDKSAQLNKLFADVDAWHQKENTRPGFAGRGKGGYEVAQRIKKGISSLRQKITKGELVDFDAEFAKLKEEAIAFREDGHGIGASGLIEKFAEVYEGINTKDPYKKREALVKFAKELREQGSYDMAMEYLDKALEKMYSIESRTMSQEGVMQKMMSDPAIMADIRKGADIYLQKFKKEHPEVPEEELRQRAEQMVFNARLAKQYKRELRQRVTKRNSRPNLGLGSEKIGIEYGSELELYNELAPYDPSVWWQPWTYSAEEWDNFKSDALEFVALTAATLPVGAVAGGVARGVGGLAFRGLMKAAPNLLVRGGAAGAEAAIAAIERGGLMTLSTSSKAFQALEPAVQRAVLHNRLLLAAAKGTSSLASVGAEGAVLLAGNTAVEGFITGHYSGITERNLIESIFKAVAYRGVGIGGSKIFGKAIEKGSVNALVAMETMAGLAGLGIDMAALYAQDLEGMADSKFVLKSLLGNALASTGTHLAHGIIRPGKEPDAAVRARREAVTVAYAGKKLGINYEKPQSIKSVSVSAKGELIINGKSADGFDVTVLDALPKNIAQRITELDPGITKRDAPHFFHYVQSQNPDQDYSGITSEMVNKAVVVVKAKGLRIEDLSPDLIRSYQNEYAEILKASDDAEFIHREGTENPKAAKESISQSISRVEEGKSNPENPMDAVLTRLKDRDPTGYRILRENSSSAGLDYIQAIVQGSRIEFTDASGVKITAYEGQHISKGGMGTVSRVAYVREGSGKLEYAVIKRPLRGQEQNFSKEVEGAKIVQQWNHPNINKAAHFGGEVIVLETGENPRPLHEAIRYLSKREAMVLLRDVVMGIKKYQQEGYAHGDLKEANILVTDTPQGPRAMLIDNTPVPGDAVKKGRAFATTQGYYSPFNVSVIRTDESVGFHAWDNYALGVIIDQSFSGTAKISELDDMVFQLQNPEKSGKPDMIDQALQEIEGLIPQMSDKRPAAVYFDI